MFLFLFCLKKNINASKPSEHVKRFRWEHIIDVPLIFSCPENHGQDGNRVCVYIIEYKGSGRGGLSPPPSSAVGNALVVIDDGIESVNVKNRYQGARVSVRRANREPEDGIRWKFVHGRVVVVR